MQHLNTLPHAPHYYIIHLSKAQNKDILGTSGAGEHGVSSVFFSSSSSSSAASSSSTSSKRSGLPCHLLKLSKLVARAVAKRVRAPKERKAAAPAEQPLYSERVLCANTAVTMHRVRKSVRRKMRNGKYVDVFTLTEDTLKEYEKAKMAGEVVEEAFLDFHRWLQVFS